MRTDLTSHGGMNGTIWLCRPAHAEIRKASLKIPKLGSVEVEMIVWQDPCVQNEEEGWRSGFQVPRRYRRSPEGCLNAFRRLRAASSEDVLAFVQEWGALGQLPEIVTPRSASTIASEPILSEPVDVVRQAAKLLDHAADLAYRIRMGKSIDVDEVLKRDEAEFDWFDYDPDRWPAITGDIQLEGDAVVPEHIDGIVSTYLDTCYLTKLLDRVRDPATGGTALRMTLGIDDELFVEDCHTWELTQRKGDARRSLFFAGGARGSQRPSRLFTVIAVQLLDLLANHETHICTMCGDAFKPAVQPREVWKRICCTKLECKLKAERERKLEHWHRKYGRDRTKPESEEKDSAS